MVLKATRKEVLQNGVLSNEVLYVLFPANTNKLRHAIWKKSPQTVELLLKLLNKYGVLFEIPEKTLQQLIGPLRYLNFHCAQIDDYRQRRGMKLSEGSNIKGANLIPHMLSEERPDSLAIDWTWPPNKKRHEFKRDFKLNFLPQGDYTFTNSADPPSHIHENPKEPHHHDD